MHTLWLGPGVTLSLGAKKLNPKTYANNLGILRTTSAGWSNRQRYPVNLTYKTFGRKKSCELGYTAFCKRLRADEQSRTAPTKKQDFPKVRLRLLLFQVLTAWTITP